MSKPKILLLGKIDHATKEWESLSDIAELTTPKATNREEFLAEARSGAFDGVVAAYRTFGSVSMTGRIDKELVGSLPESWKFLSHHGAGYDQIDIQACTDRGIKVSNVPEAADDSTADTTMFLILGALRGLNSSMNALRSGQWRGSPAPPLGHDPQGKVLGILGMGGIGRNVMRKAAVFGMTTIYHNRRPLSEEQSGGARYVSFDELLATSDVLSLNLPLNESTHHIIAAPQFAAMKRGVVVVNTARGAVMDEAALVDALASGRVRGAGLDVYEHEPAVHAGLVANAAVMLLPHMGTYSLETLRKMERCAVANVRSAVARGALLSVVPEQR